MSFANVANMRFQVTNFDADRSSFGLITSPVGRESFETIAKFTGGSISIWDAVEGETEISKQVNDNRIFAGLWSYAIVGTWGAGNEEFSSDLIIDNITQAVSGRVVITGSMYADVAIRWPAVFCYSNANAVP